MAEFSISYGSFQTEDAYYEYAVFVTFMRMEEERPFLFPAKCFDDMMEFYNNLDEEYLDVLYFNSGFSLN